MPAVAATNRPLIRLGKDAGGPDNITALIIKVDAHSAEG
jgi:hypothetical protein